VPATAQFCTRGFGLTERQAMGKDLIAKETGDTVLVFARETGLEFAPKRTPSLAGEGVRVFTVGVVVPRRAS